MITGTQLGVAYTSLAQNIYTADTPGDAVQVPPGASRVDMKGLLSPTDAENTSNNATVYLQTTNAQQLDGSEVWSGTSIPWSGGIETDKQGNPVGPRYPDIGLSLSGSEKFARVRTVPGLALSIGGEVTFS